MHNRAHQSRGFTLIELLVAISIMALLIGIFVVTFAGANEKSKETLTLSLMQTIKSGIDQFEVDFGYTPPLLVPSTLVDNPDLGGTPYPSQFPDTYEFVDPAAHSTAAEALLNARYFSTISLAAYLVGNCDLAPQTYQPAGDPLRHDGAQGPGIRNPGPDRSWGGAEFRNATTHRPPLSGEIFGPYVDVSEGKSLRRDYEFRPVNEYAPYDSLLLDRSVRNFYVFVDAWGNPIRYYRDVVKKNVSGEPSAIYAPIELLTEGLRGTSDGNLIESERMARLTASNRHVIQSSYHLLSAGTDGIFASTQDDILDQQYTNGSMIVGYSNNDFISSLLIAPELKARFDAMVTSIENNVRISE